MGGERGQRVGWKVLHARVVLTFGRGFARHGRSCPVVDWPTGTGLTAATSAPGLGSPLPHLHRDWARPCHICTGTGLTAATSSPGLGGLGSAHFGVLLGTIGGVGPLRSVLGERRVRRASQAQLRHDAAARERTRAAMRGVVMPDLVARVAALRATAEVRTAVRREAQRQQHGACGSADFAQRAARARVPLTWERERAEPPCR